MYKLMVVDDEPLVQVGIKSMIDWSKLDIEICATAYNGKQALDMLTKVMPDIVITDIKMPIMDGLEFIAQCKQMYETPPVFIVLTAYEEFSLVQQALREGAIDYVVKIELNEKVLENCVKKAIEQVKKNNLSRPSEHYIDKDLFADKFLVRLLNMTYISNEQILQQINELSISLLGKNYCVAVYKIDFSNNTKGNDQIQLYNYIIHMVEEIVSRQFSVITVPIDKYSFALIITIHLDSEEDAAKNVHTSVHMANEMTTKYFNVKVYSGLGNVYNELVKIPYSYQEALQAVKFVKNNQYIAIYKEIEKDLYKNTFNLSLFRETLTKSLDEFDVDGVESVLNEIISLLSNYTTRYLQAFDACSSILYLILTMLDSGEEILDSIFSDEVEGYKCLYLKNTIPSLVSWLTKLKDGLVTELNKKKSHHTHYVVANVEKYIQKNYRKKLSLQEVASKFNITPNYLSSIFKKYTGMGFSDYVAHTKIKNAQNLLKEGNMKIYEVSDYLGFENSYYFSKVFKKISGCSPKEYLMHCIK